MPENTAVNQQEMAKMLALLRTICAVEGIEPYTIEQCREAYGENDTKAVAEWLRPLDEQEQEFFLHQAAFYFAKVDRTDKWEAAGLTSYQEIDEGMWYRSMDKSFSALTSAFKDAATRNINHECVLGITPRNDRIWLTELDRSVSIDDEELCNCPSCTVRRMMGG